MSERSVFDALVPSSADREHWLARLDDPDAHREISSGLGCLTEPDVEPAPMPVTATGWLRLAVWNIERGRDPEAIAALISSTGADVALLSEVDIGMGRTSNRDVAREIGACIGAGSVFGVEFVELALGKTADLERAEASGNTRGLHGNAIVGRTALDRPEVIRLDDGGAWFTQARGEPRVGGRCAVAAAIALDGTTVDLVSVHLESHSDGALRAEQMASLFERIDARGSGPAIVAGDLNTFGAPLADLADRATVHRMREREPARFSWPVSHEPLFDVAASHGFAWIDANVAAPTTRHDAAARPDHVPIKLDWILVRGLEARRPTVVPALGPDGAVLSDHEMLSVSVRLPR
jgi:endonuclease/exonuclease/phosphatase family metal-dependent hydrolase